jgi:methanogenic corrinoid protein MtbC1
MWPTDLADAPTPDDCSGWAEASLRRLRNKIAPTTESRAAMHSPADFDTWIETLEQRLLGGMLSDAMAVLNGFASAGREGEVLTPLMVTTIRRLELRWRENQITTNDVALAFATARHLIDLWQSARQQGAGSHFAPEGAPRVLVSVAPGDDHTFGAQILSDDLRLRNWSVDLRIDVEGADLVTIVSRQPYDAVLLSVGHDASLAGAGDLIADLRSSSRNRGIIVLVGGSGLAQPFAQYHFLGADLIAGTAAEGAEFLASRLLNDLPYKRN